ncbi:hypothetical protein C9984_00360 [Marinobacter sp. Z-D5-3]|nr:hypothetical protein C9984_00360 [Marinobacter sp. Z-D5-3]
MLFTGSEKFLANRHGSLNMYSHIKTRGFTLVELIVTLALIALLAGLAHTSWTQLLVSNRHRDLTEDIQTMFAIARSHAINSKTLTTICPLSPARRCIDDWSLPIAVFPDRNNDKRPDNNHIHNIFKLNNGHSSVYSRTAGRGYFQLAADAMSHGTMGSLIACSRQADGRIRMSYLALNIGGRIRVLHDDDGDGEIRLPWGANIACPNP